MKQTADRLFSRYIRARDGVCQLADERCWGELECAHLIRRGYGATRWEPLNAVALCSFHHAWMTSHPLQWNAWRTERLGGATFAVLWGKALDGARPDLPAVVEDLRVLLAEVAA